MSNQFITPPNIKEPTYADAIIPVARLLVLVADGVLLFGVAAIDGPVQVALIVSCAVTALIVLKNGHPWAAISKCAGTALASVATPFFILFSVGRERTRAQLPGSEKHPGSLGSPVPHSS